MASGPAFLSREDPLTEAMKRADPPRTSLQGNKLCWLYRDTNTVQQAE